MQSLFRSLRVRTIVWLAVLVAIPALLPGTARAHDATSAPGLSPRLLADASWHGRPIQNPLPRRTDIADRAPSLRRGTGYVRPGGSQRVRDLQRRLTRLGYRPGPRDGLFGPRTQAAVLAFQRKHGLRRTGSVGSATLSVLRRRTAPGASAVPRPPVQATEAPSEGGPPPVRAQSEGGPPPVRAQSRPSAPAMPPAPPVTPAQASDEGLPALTAILLVALAIPLLMMAGLLARRRSAPAAEAPAPAKPPAPEPRPAPATQVPGEAVTDRPEWKEETPRIRRTAPPSHHVPSHERRIALRERILAMRAQGMSLQEIADQLTAEGEVTLGGARHWQPWSVRAATRPISPSGRPAGHGRRTPR